MAETLTGELYWLFWTTVFTAVIWVPYILDRILKNGLFTAMGRTPDSGFPQSGWANNAIKAHRNAIENLVVFAILVFIAHLLNVSNEVTVMAAMIFFFSRVAHFFVQTLGIPVLRTVTFFISFGAEMAIALAILDKI